MPTLPSWFGIVLIVFMVVGELLCCALPALLWALIGRQNLREAFAWRRKWVEAALGATRESEMVRLSISNGLEEVAAS